MIPNKPKRNALYQKVSLLLNKSKLRTIYTHPNYKVQVPEQNERNALEKIIPQKRYGLPYEQSEQMDFPIRS